jgi:hypothetical protein
MDLLEHLLAQGMKNYGGRPQQTRQRLRTNIVTAKMSSSDRSPVVIYPHHCPMPNVQRRLFRRCMASIRSIPPRGSCSNMKYGAVMFSILSVLVVLHQSKVLLDMATNPRFLHLGRQYHPKYDSSSKRRVIHYVYDPAEKRYTAAARHDDSSLRQVPTTTLRLVEPLGNVQRQAKIRTAAYMDRLDVVETNDCTLRYDWQKSFRPTCNTLHEEFDLTKKTTTPPVVPHGGFDNKMYQMIGNGYWRDVWVATNDLETVVFKSMRYEHDFTLRNFDRMRRDAAVMERLTYSKHIIDLYGFCGTSSFSEHGDGGDILTPLEEGTITQLERLQIGTFSSIHHARQYRDDTYRVC